MCIFLMELQALAWAVDEHRGYPCTGKPGAGQGFCKERIGSALSVQRQPAGNDA